MDNTCSYMILERSVKNLRLSGVYQLEKSAQQIHRKIHTIYRSVILCLLLLYTTQQMGKVYEVRSNVDKVMDTMFLLLTHFDCIYKVLVLWKKADQIDGFLQATKGPIFNQGVPQHKMILHKTIKNASLLLHMYNTTALFTCFLWALQPTILHIQGEQTEFQIWLPFEVNSNTRYYLSVIYIWFVTSLVAYCNTTLDIFITFSLEQCRTQVSILRFDLENFIQKSKEEAKTSRSSLSQIYKTRFYNMLHHHNEIINTVDKLQDIFGGAQFYQFLVSGWILCTSAYRIVNVNIATMELVSMTTYVMCIVTELLLYCYYGNQITYESEKLTESAYAMDWVEMPISLRRSLVIFMERIKRPIKPIAWFLVPLSNSTFISIIRSSYSFYTFLKKSSR